MEYYAELVGMYSISCWWILLSRWKECNVPTNIEDTELCCRLIEMADCGRQSV